MAREFLALGDDVLVTSRSAATARATALALAAEFPGRRVAGVRCGVASWKDVEALATAAGAELGGMDIFVANAAHAQREKRPLAETDPEELAAVAGANLLGGLLCARAALAALARQPGGGRLFLVEGAGSTGRPTPGGAAYGATKAALRQLGASLAAECHGTPVAVHMCSPGMVATGLLLQYATNPRSARIINILTEEPAVVAAWLVPCMRGVSGSGRRLAFLTLAGVAWRFATAWRRRGRFVPEGGLAPGTVSGGEAAEALLSAET
eukprot:scaffold7.g3581.t1